MAADSRDNEHPNSRRAFLRNAALTAGACIAWPALAATQPRTLLRRGIPRGDEALTVIGMGSWLTLNVGTNAAARAQRRQVIQAFFDQGGALIDSSPMYNSSEEVIGAALKEIANKQSLFAATKVWTPGKWLGVKQMEQSQRLWKVPRFDLIQIHNMLDWETHLETLKEWKAAGRVRYIGITTSHGRRHEAMEQVLATQPFDFVQFTYNVADREAEARLLPLAAERGIAVIINRPFQGGDLFDAVRGKALPPWAAECDCANWAQFFLKFIVSHPAVTCAIPATTRVDHMIENMGAARGRLPDAALRARMLAHFHSL